MTKRLISKNQLKYQLNIYFIKIINTEKSIFIQNLKN